MNVQRIRPITGPVSLRDAMDRLFEQSFVRPARGASAQEKDARLMAVNLSEKDDRYYLQAFLPGVDSDQLEISLDDNTLNLKARIANQLEKEGAKDCKWHITELGYGDVSRSITFPVPVDAEKIEASHENGVLTIEVPKAEGAKPRQIKVKSK